MHLRFHSYTLTLFAAISVLSASGCDVVNAVMSADAEVPIPTDGPEALQWLLDSKNESALASNRFLETQNAVRFVESLYAAGAKRVTVPKESIQKDEVEIYADALVVELPSQPEKRQAVRVICDKEIRREGFKPDPDNTDVIYLWWD